jgi:hypothetical protein
MSWHAVDARDIAGLHDRQLLVVERVDGFHMPPADRVVGLVPPGNENDAYLARAPVSQMLRAWSRSRCYACSKRGTPH